MINISEPVITEDEIRAANTVLRSGMLVQGKYVKELEGEFKKYVGTKYAVAVSSGTAAIHTGLEVLGIKKGDEVITTPFSFVASASPIFTVGAKVVFADIDEMTFNINPVEVEKKITKKTKAIIPVNLYGQVHDHKEIKKISNKHGLKILEDACQAVGAGQDGKKAGNFGDAAAFSLYATKNIMCGEGGMIVTDNAEIYEKARMFRQNGQAEGRKYEYMVPGLNYKMTDLSAAIALVQLKKIEIFAEKRFKNAKKLTDGLLGIEGLIMPEIIEENDHCFNQYTIRVTPDFKKTRDSLKSYLEEKGIICGVYYPKPLHLQPLFEKLGYKKGDFPVAEKMAKEVLSLPVHPKLKDKDIDFIIESIKSYGN